MFADRSTWMTAGLLVACLLPSAPPGGSGGSGGFSKVELGSPFPSLAGTDAAGNETSVAAHADHVLLLAFVRPDQELSLRVLRDLQAVYADLKLGGVEVLVVASKETPRKWADVVSEDKLTLRAIQDEGERLAEECGLVAYPTTAVLGLGSVLSASVLLHDFDFRQDVLDEVRALQSFKGGVLPEAELEKRRVAERLDQARRSREGGEYDEALTVIEELTASDPESFPLHLERGELLLLLERPKEAAGAFERARELRPQSSRALRGLGLALAGSGEDARARDLLEEVCAIDPRPGPVHRELSRIYRAAGDMEKSLEHAKLALRHARRGTR